MEEGIQRAGVSIPKIVIICLLYAKQSVKFGGNKIIKSGSLIYRSSQSVVRWTRTKVVTGSVY